MRLRKTPNVSGESGPGALNAPLKTGELFLRGTIPLPELPPPPQRLLRKGSWKKAISDELSLTDIGGITFREAIIKKARDMALAGVPWAIQFLAEREEGKPAQAISLEIEASPLRELTDSEIENLLTIGKQQGMGIEDQSLGLGSGNGGA